jgi:hypothetical protein
MKEDGLKSFNPDKAEKYGYRFITIPSTKRRVFLDSDYSVLLSLTERD